MIPLVTLPKTGSSEVRSPSVTEEMSYHIKWHSSLRKAASLPTLGPGSINTDEGIAGNQWMMADYWATWVRGTIDEEM